MSAVHESRSTDGRIYPNFLYIGAAKAGSTWIYEALREHPEVFIPRAKDTQFFDRYYDRGFDWYLSLFEKGKEKQAIGEISHNYFLSAIVSTRIREHLPEVRLFCCLREPLDQIRSNYLQRRIQSLDRDVAFEEFAFRPDVLKACDYYYNLYPFYEVFPRPKIMVLFFDHLKKDPAAFVQRVFEFLEVDMNFVPRVLHERVLSAREPRLSWLAHWAYYTGSALRKLGLVNVVGLVKRNGAVQKLLYRQTEKKPVIPEGTEKELLDYYRERYKDLANLIGQPLPEAWL